MSGVVEASRCSYSFVVKEVTSPSCICDTQGAESQADGGSEDGDDVTLHKQQQQQQHDDASKSNHVIMLQNYVEETHEADDDVILQLRHHLRQLQTRQDHVYNKLKDVEIRFYKENVRNFHLETLIDRQEDTIAKLREMLQQVRETVAASERTVDLLRRDTDTQMRAMQLKVEANADTLYKQSRYLEDIEQRQRGVTSRAATLKHDARTKRNDC